MTRAGIKGCHALLTGAKTIMADDKDEIKNNC